MEVEYVRKSKGMRRQLLADHSYTGEKPPPDSSGEEMEESRHSEKTIADKGLSEAERYRRRWGLRLYGVPEDHGENVKRIARNQGSGAYYRGIRAFFADGK
ncbi:unnamed protein product [Coregonus sp. 'balchen']|nr:unnamed protein product [Coregonus sp. 'balchen']